MIKGYASCLTNDIYDYENRVPNPAGDFLNPDWRVPREKNDSRRVDAVVMNPPFNNTLEFIEKSLALKPLRGVWMLGRLAYLESGIRHDRLFSKRLLQRVVVFSERIGFTKGKLTESAKSVYPTRGFISRKGTLHLPPSLNGFPPVP